jgi:hypothetical protein
MKALWFSFLTALAVLFFVAPAGSLEPQHVNKVPQCLAADLGAACGGEKNGNAAWVTDGLDASDCATGLGTHGHLCYYNGTSWVPVVGGNEDKVVFTSVYCGQLDENGTIYLGNSANDVLWSASTAGADLSIGSATCDGFDHATDATINSALFTDTAVKVLGMVCATDGTLGAAETLAFTLQVNDADSVPAVTCSLAVGEVDCSALIQSTTDIAAAEAVSVEAVMVSDNADDNAWCQVTFAVQ